MHPFEAEDFLRRLIQRAQDEERKEEEEEIGTVEVINKGWKKRRTMDRFWQFIARLVKTNFWWWD